MQGNKAVRQFSIATHFLGHWHLLCNIICEGFYLQQEIDTRCGIIPITSNLRQANAQNDIFIIFQESTRNAFLFMYTEIVGITISNIQEGILSEKLQT